MNQDMVKSQRRMPYINQPTVIYKYSDQNNQCGESCGDIYFSGPSTNEIPEAIPFVRVVKRRTTANKKERRRTQSINSAFADLRDRIPNVPSDTKLSKVTFDLDEF